MAGYPDVKNWGAEDLVTWGVSFMKANDGMLPSQSMIDYLSSKKLCPSASTVANRFDRSLVGYQAELKAAHDKRTLEERTEREAILATIKSGQLPPELFQNTKTEAQRLVNYARYIVADELLSKDMVVTKISIGAMNTDSVIRDGFVRSIRKNNPAITAGDIESTALYLGVFDYIWPMDDYMETLCIDGPDYQAFMVKRRHYGRQSRKRKSRLQPG
jgi:hypothetical protein